MKNQYRKEFLYPLCVAFAVLSMTMSWMFYVIYGLVELSDERDRVDIQRNHIVALNSAIYLAESSQRGYLLTNNVTYLDVLEISRDEANELIRHILTFNQNYPETIPIFNRVKKTIDEKFKLMDSNIKIQLLSGSYASHLSVAKDTGKHLMDSIKADLALANEALLQHKKRHDKEIKRKIKESMLSAVMLVLFTFGILIVGYQRTFRLFEQVIESKDAVENLGFQATHDALTNALNRRGFEKQLKKTHALALRVDKKYALFYMDLDHFKAVNDCFGHDVGDALLIEVTSRFNKTVREYDTLARLGGDEFALIIHDFQTQYELAELAQRLIETLNSPIEIAGNALKVSVSIGIALFPKDARSIDLLQAEADSAMYQSKAGGKNRYTFSS